VAPDSVPGRSFPADRCPAYLVEDA